MNFLLVASFPESIISFRGALIDAISSKGVTVHVAAPGLSSGVGMGGALESRGVVIHEIPLRRAGTNPVRDLILLLALIRLMRQVRPRWVMGYTIKPVIYGMLAAWIARVPNRFALVTGLGYAFTSERKGLLTKLVQRLYGLALGKAHKAFFQNADDLMLFRKMGILGPTISSVVVNGSGVDVANYAVAPFPEGEMNFLLIARLLGDKGVREYAQAARRVRAKFPEVKFALIGWIDENPDAISQRELDAWIAEGTLEFLGRLDDVRPAIAACSVYVLPSYREGTPRTVLEAMAMGRPVITSDAPGCRETVVDGDNGFLVPVKSVDGLVEAMARFIADPSLGRRMGQRSRAIAEDKYKVEKINDLLLREMGIV